MVFFMDLDVYENGEERFYKMQFFLVAQRTRTIDRTIDKVLRKVFGQLQKVEATNQM